MKLFLKAARLGAFTLAGLALLGIIAAAVINFYLVPQLPSAEILRDVRYQVPLRIYTADEKLLAEYGEMRRTPVKVDAVPDLMVKAILAAEDGRFFHHPGVDYQGLMRAAWVLLTTGEKTQGGSTITMQVARNFFLGREKTYLRKLNEILLAFKIEREFSKQEILELYLNKIYLGQRAYGVAAAAQAYYGKELPQLSLPEMAMIAGLPKAPSRFNPIADPQRALARRNYVLGRMRDLGYITESNLDKATKERDAAQHHTLPVETEAPYLAEMARAEVLQRFGDEAYTTGLKVYTTLDTRLQGAANHSLRNALLEYDRRHGYRGPEAHVSLPAGSGAEQWRTALTEYTLVGGLAPGVVAKISDNDITVGLKEGRSISVPWDAMRWAHRQVNENQTDAAPGKPADIVKVGDIVRLDLNVSDRVRFTQLPEVEGALVGLRPSDGAIVALVGGFDFFRSKFNRVSQAARQPGSSFKPFVYSAALEHGMTPATVINDAPVVFDDPDLEDAWRPENYSGRFYGPTRLREGLVHSRNLVSIRVLSGIGINDAIDYVARFGFDKQALPRNLSLALGSGVTTPLNLASAYAVFANSGYRVTPYFMLRIEDGMGNVLWKAQPVSVCSECDGDVSAGAAITDGAVLPTAAPVAQSNVAAEPQSAPRVISAQNAYLMTSMMKDVIRRGTGQQARELGRNDVAGKTGTTNDQRDAWFAGYSPNMVAVAWVGFDDTHPLGNAETGGRAALPMWIDFMRAAVDGIPDQPGEQPPGLVSVRINPESGLVAGPEEHDAIFETFFADNVPAKLAGGQARGFANTAPGGSAPAVPEQLF